MKKLKSSLTSLDQNYVFSLVASRKKPGLINLGVGDILSPLRAPIAAAIKSAVDEMSTPSGVRGYGPELGYDFLRQKIKETYYKGFTVDQILINDGIASDITLILDLFEEPIVVIQDPTYPPYFETLKMRGLFDKAIKVPCTKETNYIPLPPKQKADVIFLCSPQNPTGVALTRKELKAWVDYAKQCDAVILFDAAYQAFITREEVPSSIYEIEGAKDVAIEFSSFSKTSGFTGLRCGYTVCPVQSILPHFQRLKTARTNGVAYPIQRGAEAALLLPPLCFKESMELLRSGMLSLGFEIVGGIDCPYIWWKIPNEMDSLTFFDYLITNFSLLAIPGSGFGLCGEGYMRLSALTSKETIRKALEALKTYA